MARVVMRSDAFLFQRCCARPSNRKGQTCALAACLKEQKVGIIFISHNLVDIFAVADRVLVLRRGIAAGERHTDEIVRLMMGAEPTAA